MPHKLYSYQNFDVDVNSSAMLVIVIGIAVGLMIGIILSLICKTASAKIVKAIVTSGAKDENSAKTIDELGLSKVKFTKNMLKPDSPLFKTLCCIESEDDYAKKQNKFSIFWYNKLLGVESPAKLNYSTARFYLPEDKRVSAELRFAEEKHPVRNAVISIVLLVAMCFFAIYVIPELLQMLDNLITQIQPQGNIL